MAGEKLYPPTISSSIPAFYNNNGTVSITVPFSMNRAVSAGQVGGFALKIKTAQSNVWLTTLEVFDDDNNADISSYIANRAITFTWDDSSLTKIKLGQYLKFQLAYISTPEAGSVVGFFSTVAIGKYTSKPTVIIKNADSTVAGAIPSFLQTYTGVYQPGEDRSERPYQYCFLLYDENMALVETSTWKTHNSLTDETVNETLTLDEASDTYIYQTSLEENKVYYIQYGVRTINNLEIYSTAYPCAEINGGDDTLSLSINAENNFDEGYIKLSFSGTLNDNHDETAVSLQIERSEITDDFQGWKVLKRIYFKTYNDVKNWTFRDFTVEQGIYYQYRYKIYNSNNVVAKQITLPEPVMADFEDMFLLGENNIQLKIRFNPKVSSFKTTLLEQKMDTIGSKYPFIFRNGIVSYKEFPIAGLISYLADNNEMFIHHEEDLGIILPDHSYLSSDEYVDSYTRLSAQQLQNLDGATIVYYQDDGLWVAVEKASATGNVDYYIKESILVNRGREKTPTERTTYERAATLNSVGYNMRAERRFKLKLLNWLNDGKIKLFRSPAEGNYLVRIMNVALQPEDRLSRMIHNFSCQAYEVEELTYNNLLNLGFIDINGQEEIIERIEGVRLWEVVNNEEAVKLNANPIYNYVSIHLADNSNSNAWLYIRIGPSPNNKVLVNARNGLTLDYPDSAIPDIYFYPSDNAELKGNNQTYVDMVTGVILDYNCLVSKILAGNVYDNTQIVDQVYLQNIMRTYYGTEADIRNISLPKSYLVGALEKHDRIKILTLYFHRKTIVQIINQNGNYYFRDNPTVQVSSYSSKNIYEVYSGNQLTGLYAFYNNQLRAIAGDTINYTVQLTKSNNVVADFAENPIISLGEIDFDRLRIGNGIYVECATQEKVTKYKTNS